MATGGSEERQVLTILWRIENIGLAESRHLWTGVTSPVFRARTLEAKIFHLSLKPNHEEVKNKQLTLNFHLSEDPMSFPIDCEWSFIGGDGSPVVSGIVRKHVMKRNEPFKMSGCPTHEEIFVSRKSDFLPNDALTIRFRLWSSEGDLSKKELVSCRTKFEPIDHSFLWSIEEFRALNVYQELLTPVRFGDVETDNFLLKLSLRGDPLQESSVNVELTPVSIGSNLSATMNIYISSRDRKELKRLLTHSERTFLEGSTDTWILPEPITGNELLMAKSGPFEEALNLQCDIRTVWYTEVIDKYYYGISNEEVDSYI